MNNIAATFGHWSTIGAVSVMLVVGTTAPGPAAADASRWDGDHRSAVRLIAAAPLGAGSARILRAGIELKLAAGWKMYWRHPGDAGVPPRFDFAGSKNVRNITVLWPAPQRFSEERTHLIVYKGNVIMPLRIVPENPAKPAVIRLKLDYGICETLCILAEAKSELVLASDATSHERAVTAAEARVPRKVAIGQRGSLSILAVQSEPGSNGHRIIVEVSAPRAVSVDLFVEGPTPEWALPLPEQISSGAGLWRFAFDLNGVPPGVSAKGAVLTFTAVADEEAIEVSTPID